jgi:hypothetical protein
MGRCVLSVILAALCVSCGLLPASDPQREASDEGDAQAYAGLGLDVFPGYQARFDLRFEGAYTWRYRLETTADGQVVEQQLHLEGLGESQNPGNIRAVLEPGRVSMRGPGTNDECVFFPAHREAATAFLTPDDLLEPAAFEGTPSERGTGAIAGRRATQYSLSQTSVDGWTEVEAEIWLDDATGAVLRYDLFARGADPLFDAGTGLLTGEFRVEEVAPQEIEPIAGCDIDLPLPAQAQELTKLPGLISFETSASPLEIAVFFEAELADEGWSPQGESTVNGDTTVLGYRRGFETLEIAIEEGADTVHVQLWLSEE